MGEESVQARLLHIDGIVQGVGFRPFVARLARSMGLSGWVRNDPQGVTVLVQHDDPKALDEFAQRLPEQAPAAARVLALAAEQVQAVACDGFEIAASTARGARNTLVSPDLATCPQCLAELFDPNDRRYRYPFINCTNCGPRFTIIDGLPYDRPATSMRDFDMCQACAAEYADENDRRYHAQPDACFACGPRLWLSDGEQIPPLQEHQSQRGSDAIIEACARRLAAGEVLAVKGLGGWHLVCDAGCEQAVARLRKRKHRPAKPLAVMARDLDMARMFAHVSKSEAQLLESPAHPIVLLERRDTDAIANGVAALLPELGVMLPSTPVQHLLAHVTNRPLVMTSGNRSGEPIVADDAEALDALAGIADGFVGNDRAIVARYDDSVARVARNGRVQFVRRARGYAPTPLFITRKTSRTSVIFAAGPQQKATFCFLKGQRAYISQHLGDLECAGAWSAWLEARERYAELFDLQADAFACDLHPDYLAGKWAREQAGALGLPIVEVQHHHAHVASVLAENDLNERVIGVALDGTGYGSDGTIWGCEVMVADRAEFERFWHLPAFPLPGGSAAIKNPRRTAYSLLRTFGALDERKRAECGLQGLTADNAQWADFLDGLEERELLDQMMEKRINSPLCSSLGRAFDGVAALLGLCDTASYDGEPACLLEAAAVREGAPCRQSGASAAPLTAFDFHERICKAIINACIRANAAYGIRKIALSGGCMVNRLLARMLREGLRDAGLAVFENRELPPNDGCISYGQAIVAAARLLEG